MNYMVTNEDLSRSVTQSAHFMLTPPPPFTNAQIQTHAHTHTYTHAHTHTHTHTHIHTHTHTHTHTPHTQSYTFSDLWGTHFVLFHYSLYPQIWRNEAISCALLFSIHTQTHTHTHIYILYVCVCVCVCVCVFVCVCVIFSIIAGTTVLFYVFFPSMRAHYDCDTC